MYLQPTGKKPMNKNVVYVLSAIGITFLMSFALSLFSKETTQFCFLIDSYCFNSTENQISLHVLYFYESLDFNFRNWNCLFDWEKVRRSF